MREWEAVAMERTYHDVARQESLRREWGTVCTAGILAGMLYGGAKEAAATAEGPDVLLPRAQREQFRMQRGLMEDRLLRITRGSLVGGVQLGAFAALFSGTQLAVAHWRGRDDSWSYAAAGGVSGGVWGLVVGSSSGGRLRTAGFGCAMGVLLALPLGILRTKLRSLAPDPSQAARTEDARPNDEVPKADTRQGQDGVLRAIMRLEEGLKHGASSGEGDKETKA